MTGAKERSNLAEQVREAVNQRRNAAAPKARYERHLEQYKSCRAVAKDLEMNMLAGDVMFYRDFVAQYNCDGRKIANLVLVALWRETDGGFLHTFKFNNFCSNKKENSADAFYVADVFNFMLGQGGNHTHLQFMDGIRMKAKNHDRDPRLFIVGDHGTHFVDVHTMYNESTFYAKYGFETYVFFLCSYHSFNRCDGAGVESIRLQNSALRDRRGWRWGYEFAAGINRSSYHNSVGFDFPVILRDDSVFPVKCRKQKKTASDASWGIRQRCEVRYYWFEEGVPMREDGVILLRYVPVTPPSTFWAQTGQRSMHAGAGEPFEVLDMRANPPGGLLCEKCSKSHQRPLRHALNSSECISSSKESVSSRVKNDSIAVVGPDPERVGPDNARYQTDKRNRKKKGWSVPLPLQDLGRGRVRESPLSERKGI